MKKQKADLRILLLSEEVKIKLDELNFSVRK